MGPSQAYIYLMVSFSCKAPVCQVHLQSGSLRQSIPPRPHFEKADSEVDDRDTGSARGDHNGVRRKRENWIGFVFSGSFTHTSCH